MVSCPLGILPEEKGPFGPGETRSSFQREQFEGDPCSPTVKKDKLIIVKYGRAFVA